MISLEEKRKRSLTECPLYALEIKSWDGESSEEEKAWQPRGIYFDREEAMRHIKSQEYRYPENEKDKFWRLRVVPAAGDTMRSFVRLTDKIEAIIKENAQAIINDIERINK